MSISYHVPLELLGNNDAERKTGVWARIWKNFEAAQSRRAKAIVLKTLPILEDETLLASGYDAEDIARLRRGVFVAPK